MRSQVTDGHSSSQFSACFALQSRLRVRYGTDRQTTSHQRLMLPSYGEWGIINDNGFQPFVIGSCLYSPHRSFEAFNVVRSVARLGRADVWDFLVHGSSYGRVPFDPDAMHAPITHTGDCGIRSQVCWVKFQPVF